jgi:hypothetical protein
MLTASTKCREKLLWIRFMTLLVPTQFRDTHRAGVWVIVKNSILSMAGFNPVNRTSHVLVFFEPYRIRLIEGGLRVACRYIRKWAAGAWRTYGCLLPHLNLLHQVMKRFALKLLLGASSAKKEEAHQINQSKTILNNAITVFQQLIDLGSAGTFNVLELGHMTRIRVRMVEICKVRTEESSF